MQAFLTEQKSGAGHAASGTCDRHGTAAAAQMLGSAALYRYHRMRDPAAEKLIWASHKKHPQDSAGAGLRGS